MCSIIYSCIGCPLLPKWTKKKFCLKTNLNEHSKIKNLNDLKNSSKDVVYTRAVLVKKLTNLNKVRYKVKKLNSMYVFKINQKTKTKADKTSKKIHTEIFQLACYDMEPYKHQLRLKAFLVEPLFQLTFCRLTVKPES